MRTADLIHLLAQDDTPVRPIAPRLMAWAGLALLAAAVPAIALLGIRVDLAAALADQETLMKWLLPLCLAVPALWTAMRLSQPQTRRVPAAAIPLIVALAAVIWWAVSIILAQPGTLWPQMRGNSMFVCLTSITTISILPLVVGLRVLKDGASPRPVLTGAMIGLAVGGLATAFYALHCNEDAPLFFLTWYGLGILIVTCAGALAGHRMLRW